MPIQTTTGPFFTLKTGDLAYIDTFRNGLVPCKVVAVEHVPNSLHPYATVKVTATRGAYKRGTVVPFMSPHLSLVKRTQVFTNRGQYMISGQVVLVPDNAPAHTAQESA